MTPAHKRRWPRFSLRTLFVAVTVLACWMAYEVNWIRQRHVFLDEQERLSRMHEWPATVPGPKGLGAVRAPGLLWLFGEPGIGAYYVLITVNQLDEFGDQFDWESHQTMRKAKRLFPETNCLPWRTVTTH